MSVPGVALGAETSRVPERVMQLVTTRGVRPGSDTLITRVDPVVRVRLPGDESEKNR